MIQVPADIFRVLASGSFAKRLRVTWTLNNGQTIRLHEPDRTPSVSSVTRTLIPMLGGYRVSNCVVSISNHDQFLSPNKSTSFLYRQKRADWLDSTMTVEQEVYGPETGWHAIPVYTGFVSDLTLGGAVAEFTVYDRLTRLLNLRIPDAIVVDFATITGQLIEDWLTTYSVLTTSELHSDSFDNTQGMQLDLAWYMQGFIPQNTPLATLVSDAARSGMANLYPQEDGKIRLDSEWPVVWGQDSRVLNIFPVTLSEDTALNVQERFAASARAATVVVQYQGIEVEHRNATAETELGYGEQEAPAKVISMPYLVRGALARWAAQFFYESQTDYLDQFSCEVPGLGLLLQVNDRVPVQSKHDDTVRQFRVMSKSWSSTTTRIEAVRESHYDTILAGTFAQEGSTAWSSTTEEAL